MKLRIRQRIAAVVPRTLLQVVTAAAAIALGVAAVYAAMEYGPFAGLSWVEIGGFVFVALVAGAAGWEYWDTTDAAEVYVDGPITRETSSPWDEQASANEICEAIAEAEEEDEADGLILHLNTPGGEIVPSEDIRVAVEDFDGPVVGVAEDVCASGGYLIATACDHLVARESSLIGSIGVIGSQLNMHDLADDLGVGYEQFTAGKFKDAGHQLKELSDEERQYLQTLVDENYDLFVERVMEGRDLSRAAIEDYGARVFLGRDAVDADLVDAVGNVHDADEWLAEQLNADGEDLETVEYDTKQSGFSLAASAQSLAYAVGEGIGARLEKSVSLDDVGFRFR